MKENMCNIKRQKRKLSLLLLGVLFISTLVLATGCKSKIDMISEIETMWRTQSIEVAEQYFTNPTNLQETEQELIRILNDIGLSEQDIENIAKQYRNISMVTTEKFKLKEYYDENKILESVEDTKGMSVYRVDIKYADVYTLVKDLMQINADARLMGQTTEDMNEAYSKKIIGNEGVRKNITKDLIIYKDDSGHVRILNKLRSQGELDKLMEEYVEGVGQVNLETILLGNASILVKQMKSGKPIIKTYEIPAHLNTPTGFENKEKSTTQADEPKNEVEREAQRQGKGKGHNIFDVDPDTYGYVPPSNVTETENWFNNGYDDSMGKGYKEGMFEDPSMYMND